MVDQCPHGPRYTRFETAQVRQEAYRGGWSGPTLWNDGIMDRPPINPPEPLWARMLIGRPNALTPLPRFAGEDLMTAWEHCEDRCAVSGSKFCVTVVQATGLA
jgi:hypothetical protein